MRIALVSALAVLSLVTVPGGTAGSAGAAPTLRVGNTEFITLVGAGFAPRSVVRLRVTGAGIDRAASVRANLRGGFIARFRDVERCSVRLATARAAGGTLARVPPPWFVRECPPPPPLAPGVTPA